MKKRAGIFLSILLIAVFAAVFFVAATPLPAANASAVVFDETQVSHPENYYNAEEGDLFDVKGGVTAIFQGGIIQIRGAQIFYTPRLSENISSVAVVNASCVAVAANDGKILIVDRFQGVIETVETGFNADFIYSADGEDGVFFNYDGGKTGKITVELIPNGNLFDADCTVETGGTYPSYAEKTLPEILFAKGDEADRLNSPADVAAPSSNLIYVLDAGNKRIMKYVGDEKTVERENVTANAIAATEDGTLYVSADGELDLAAHGGNVYAITETGIRKNGLNFPAPKNFPKNPVAVCLSARGDKLYALGATELAIYPADGAFNTVTTIRLTDYGIENAPAGIAADFAGNLYISENAEGEAPSICKLILQENGAYLPETFTNLHERFKPKTIGKLAISKDGALYAVSAEMHLLYKSSTSFGVRSEEKDAETHPAPESFKYDALYKAKQEVTVNFARNNFEAAEKLQAGDLFLLLQKDGADWFGVTASGFFGYVKNAVTSFELVPSGDELSAGAGSTYYVVINGAYVYDHPYANAPHNLIAPLGAQVEIIDNYGLVWQNEGAKWVKARYAFYTAEGVWAEGAGYFLTKDLGRTGNNPRGGANGLSGGAIAGIVAGGVVCLTTAVLTCIFLVKRKRKHGI